MKGAWPSVTVSLERKFWATHSLPGVGVAEKHAHEYLMRFGYRHEIQPRQGVTKALRDMGRDVDAVVKRLFGADLNKVLPLPPTAEVLALWALAHLPNYWDFVEVEAYGDFRARVDRQSMLSVWLEFFAGRGKNPMQRRRRK